MKPYFYTHYLATAKAPEAFGDEQMQRPKVWCKECFDRRVSQEMESDRLKVLSSVIPMAREDRVVREMCMSHSNRFLQLIGKNLVWATPKATDGWFQARSDSYVTHLVKCPHQPEHVTILALQEQADRAARKADRKKRKLDDTTSELAIASASHSMRDMHSPMVVSGPPALGLHIPPTPQIASTPFTHSPQTLEG